MLGFVLMCGNYGLPALSRAGGTSPRIRRGKNKI